MLSSYRRECLLHAAAVHVRVDAGVELVQHVGFMGSSSGGARAGG